MDHELLNSLEFGTECEHCGAMSLSKEVGFRCVVCSKVVLGRALRNSTLDKASKNYAGCDVDEETDPRCKTPSPKKSRKNSDAPLNFLPCCTGADRETPESTIAEFKTLMARTGMMIGSNQDDTASKYIRYMRLLFETGKFGCRSDFFLDGARADAYSVYVAEAERLRANGAKTPQHKLVGSMKWGFEKFVELADKDGTCPKCGDNEARKAKLAAVFDEVEEEKEIDIADLLSLVE